VLQLQDLLLLLLHSYPVAGEKVAGEKVCIGKGCGSTPCG